MIIITADISKACHVVAELTWSSVQHVSAIVICTSVFFSLFPLMLPDSGKLRCGECD